MATAKTSAVSKPSLFFELPLSSKVRTKSILRMIKCSTNFDCLQLYLFPILVHDSNAKYLKRSRIGLRPGQRRCVKHEVVSLKGVVPKRRNPLLDRDFPSFVARDSRLQKLSFELYEKGMTRLGHVVQMSKSELQLNTSASDEIIARLERFLSEAGLGLEMTTLGWRPGRSGSGRGIR